jgi:SAM-dependent methyltransferase
MRLNNVYNKNFYKTIKGGSSGSAALVAPIIMNFLKPASIIDIGCGTGEWLKEFSEFGVEVTGVDGDYVPREYLKIAKEKFIAHDLSRPFTIEKKFDLAVSLEVAEHLPKSRAESFIKELTDLAPVILFSAAIPGQGGHNHINEQWPSYWVNFFDKYGYAPIDILRELIWDNEKIEWWYRQNLLLFINKSNIEDYPLLKDKVKKNVGFINLVHPENYLLKQSSFRKIVRTILLKLGL